MALPDFKNSFAARATALGLTAAAVLTPLSGGHAQDSSAVSERPAVIAISAETQSLTPEQIARLEVDAAAFDYAMANPGHISIAVFRGPDAGPRTAEDLASGFEQGIEGRYRIPAAGYAGDNGDRPTTIQFYYQSNYEKADPVVMGKGPYNMEQALAQLPNVITAVQATNLYSSLNFNGQN